MKVWGGQSLFCVCIYYASFFFHLRCSKRWNPQPLHGLLTVTSFQLCGHQSLGTQGGKGQTAHFSLIISALKLHLSLSAAAGVYSNTNTIWLSYEQEVKSLNMETGSLPRSQRWAVWSSYRCRMEPPPREPHANRLHAVCPESYHVSSESCGIQWSSDSVWGLGKSEYEIKMWNWAKMLHI